MFWRYLCKVVYICGRVSGMKPRILLTTRPSDNAAPVGESRYREYVLQSYVNALRNQGAIVTLVPISDPEDVPVLLSAVDGLVVAGGRDFNPETYGQVAIPETGVPHDALDRSDLSLLVHAKEIQLPTLGVCRGMQGMNIASGGTLVQDIAGKRANHPPEAKTFKAKSKYRHNVILEADSWLAKAHKTTSMQTNSIHHQCLDELGEGFRVVARAEDGTIEAIESTTDWFAVGTQWHPELMDNAEELFGQFLHDVSLHRSLHDRRDDTIAL